MQSSTSEGAKGHNLSDLDEAQIPILEKGQEEEIQDGMNEETKVEDETVSKVHPSPITNSSPKKEGLENIVYI